MPTVNIGANTGDSGGVEDTRIRSANPDNNYGGSWLGLSNLAEYTVAETICLKFDLSPIPSNVTVTAATLFLYLNNSGIGTTEQVIDIHASLRAWVEAQATWNNWSSGNAWTTPGALGNGTDRETTAFLSGGTFNRTHEWKSWTSPGMVSQFQDWISGSETNNGLIIYSVSGPGWRVFTASEETDGERPYVQITYEEAGGVAEGFGDDPSMGTTGFGGLLR